MSGRVLWTCFCISLVALCAPALMKMQVLVVYNPTDSVARGWYRIKPVETLHVGSVVLVRLPEDVAAFAARRGYLPLGVPLLKRVGAVSPQVVCVRNGIVHIDGAAVAAALTHDEAHRRMHLWVQCRALAEDELFLLSNIHAASFDSRYFGPVGVSAVIGRALPIGTRSSL